ncbi:MAG TPA: VIT domain-containing protein, partial [Polyangiaceae bacterium]|nr:VIT domain-containing protein [Polyangiaceae bacterium]
MTKPALLPLSPHDLTLEPDGPARGAGLACDRGPLPLRGVDVHAKIVGLVAEVLVTQSFVNDFDGPIEATYTFPLPDRAALTECRVSFGGRRLRGVLRERGEAREGYEGALRAGRSAALAEEDRPDVFTMTLGNLGPGERAEVRLALVMPLDARDGEATFRFPLVVAPRFVPGAPLDGPAAGTGVEADTDRVGDASRVSPPRLAPGGLAPVRLSLTIDLEAPGHDLGELRSSLHELALAELPWGYRLTLPPGERLDRDVVVRFGARRQGAPARLLVRRDREGEGATFALTLDPEPAGGPAPPRDVVFVLDRS